MTSIIKKKIEIITLLLNCQNKIRLNDNIYLILLYDQLKLSKMRFKKLCLIETQLY